MKNRINGLLILLYSFLHAELPFCSECFCFPNKTSRFMCCGLIIFLETFQQKICLLNQDCNATITNKEIYNKEFNSLGKIYVCININQLSTTYKAGARRCFYNKSSRIFLSGNIIITRIVRLFTWRGQIFFLIDLHLSVPASSSQLIRILMLLQSLID